VKRTEGSLKNLCLWLIDEKCFRLGEFMPYRMRYYSAYALEKLLFAKHYLSNVFYSPLSGLSQYKSMKKLNLACSDRIIPGWLNVDARDIPGIDHVVDVRNLSKFSDNSFDIVRASHVLEHFYINELEHVLREWTRVLRPGGWLILCVPDFDANLLRYKVNPHVINPCLAKEFGPAVLSQIYGFGYESDENHLYKHRMVYNRMSLISVMRQYGKLKNIRTLNYLREEPYAAGITDDSTNVYSLNLAGQK